MVEQNGRPGRASSPYSRTGLFPWGSTYEVPARREGQRAVSHTPCHLRPVGVPETGQERAQVRCPACGRAWSVQVAWGAPSPKATWTA